MYRHEYMNTQLISLKPFGDTINKNENEEQTLFSLLLSYPQSSAYK